MTKRISTGTERTLEKRVLLSETDWVNALWASRKLYGRENFSQFAREAILEKYLTTKYEISGKST